MTTQPWDTWPRLLRLELVPHWAELGAQLREHGRVTAPTGGLYALCLLLVHAGLMEAQVETGTGLVYVPRDKQEPAGDKHEDPGWGLCHWCEAPLWAEQPPAGTSGTCSCGRTWRLLGPHTEPEEKP